MTMIHCQENVLEAALQRIRRLYDEFPTVIVNFSGGKDSTVVLNLALQVATERGRLPVPVLFLDQEAEWRTVITYIRSVMDDQRVQPLWFQGPFQIFNASSATHPWLQCWAEGADWMRPKESDSIHDNRTGTTTFSELFSGVSRLVFGTQLRCHLSGVRCEESPSRRRGLTSYLTYKDITWGNASGKRWNQYTFYPLYDWRYSDIWKAIHVHGWPYCALYDYYYQYGIPVTKMRVSNVHHETALDSLLFMQELEPDTWEQVTARVQDVNTVTQARAAYRVPETLPWMFPSWETYRDYLLDHVITDAAIRARFVALFAQWDRLFVPSLRETVTKAEIAALLVNDYHGTKYDTFRAAHGRDLLSYQERRTA